MDFVGHISLLKMDSVGILDSFPVGFWPIFRCKIAVGSSRGDPTNPTKSPTNPTKSHQPIQLT